MSPSARPPWTWAALALWLGRSLLAATIAVSMLFGPELADRSWDQGVHVTPAQAAMHFALVAQGFAHHHGRTAKVISHAEMPSQPPAVETANPPPDWGTSFIQSIHSQPGCCQMLVAGLMAFFSQLRPASTLLAPPAPPPRAAFSLSF